MRVAYISSCKGKVHDIRIKAIKKILPDINFDVYVPPRKPNAKKYDVIYYAFYSLYKRMPISHPNIVTSVTSHKCLDNLKQTLRQLSKFKLISVNNRKLYKEFSKHIDVIYIPNGVDTEMFYPSKRVFDPNDIVFGWIGNIDRATKNFHSIIKPLKKKFKFKTIETKKSKKYNVNHKSIVNFYHSIDFYVVSSGTEGTPNPALEAASCGIPLITTKVGNMADIVVNGENGYFIDSPCFDDALDSLSMASRLSKEEYCTMSDNIKGKVRKSWSWFNRIKEFSSLFGAECE